MAERFSQELVRGSLDILVLSALAENAKYGYLIQKHVREATASQASLSAGTLYPLLHRLEEQKLVRSHWEDETGRRRKWYVLTAAGRKRLTNDARQFQSFAATMTQLLAGVLKPPAEPA